ncbi:MAG: hypothetical protein KDK30_11580, partial [Leptospiraceae bacterium]|nr:hypothetical protein [Leptospiraceae bacterium]
NSFRTKGRFFSPDSSPVLHGMVLCSYIFDDIVQANKFCAALLAALAITPIFWLAWRATGQPIAGFFAALAIGASWQFNVFTFEFVKNLGGIVGFLWVLAAGYDLLQSGTWKRVSCIALFPALLLALSAHKLMAGATLLCLIAIGALYLLHALYQRHNVFLKRHLLPLLVGLALLSLAPLLAMLWLPNLLHPDDFQRFTGISLTDWQWAWWSYQKLDHPNWIVSGESLASIALCGLSTIVWIRQGWQKLHHSRLPPEYFFWVVIPVLAFLAQFPLLPFQSYDFAYRLYLLLFIPGTLAVIYLWQRFGHRREHSSESSDSRPNHIFRRSAAARLVLVSGICALLIIWQVFTLRYVGRKHHVDYARYDAVKNRLEELELPPDALVIAHQGMDYFLCFHSDVDAFHFLPEAKHADRPVFRLVYGLRESHRASLRPVPGPALLRSSSPKPPGLVPTPAINIDDAYVFLRESDWQQFLRGLPEQDRRIYHTWRNPYEARPDYMRRNDRFKSD